ncbi:MAG: type II secretion system F family protein [Candidatus Woesearchaeota archaeon]
MDLYAKLASKKPMLKKQLRMAKINQSPQQFVRDAVKKAITMSIAFTLLVFLIAAAAKIPLITLPVFFIIFLYIFFNFNIMSVKGRISKRQKEIDKDVLFAGKYLLVKLNGGQPLVNALLDASKSYGVASVYFKEIVREIELGKSIEDALDEATEYNPSQKFKKILFQINNALKIGIDVTKFLEATLNEIAEEQLIEINRYGKKLNSVTLFYMLLAVVVPSLGLTIAIVVASLANIDISIMHFAVVLFFLALIQVMFLVVYKSIRPNINI